MQKYFDTVISDKGRPVVGASIVVTKNDGTSTSIYSDNGVTVLESLATNENGFFEFYAADGRYRVAGWLAGVKIFQLNDVLLEDQASAIAAAVPAATLSASGGSALVGHGSDTVASALDALQLADYAALRAYTGNRKSVYVTGYLASAAPSGIAGLFTLDSSDTTTADNGGTVIVAANGKRWKRRYEGAVDVHWFGAVGDGATDDQPAFLRASTYLLSLPYGGALACRSGKVYAFGARWSVPKTLDKQVVINMNGSTFTKTAGGWAGAILYYGAASENDPGFPLVLYDGVFQGLGAGGTGLEMQWAGGSSISNVIFRNFVQGVYLTNCFAVRFGSKCHFMYCSTAGILCSTICHNLTIDGCSFFGNQRDLYFTTGAPAYNLNFINNDCEGSFAAGAACLSLEAGGASINVDGCYVEGKSGSPMQFGAAVESFKLTNSWFGYNTGTQAWSLINSGVLEGNIFWDQQQTVGASVKDFDIGQNTWAGTSNVIYTPWQTPTLLNGFTNTGGTWAGNVAGFRKDRHGVVHLRGVIQAAADNAAFTLPAGYRPDGLTAFIGGTANGGRTDLCRVQVSGGGNVAVYRGADGTGELSGISFTAAK